MTHVSYLLFLFVSLWPQWPGIYGFFPARGHHCNHKTIFGFTIAKTPAGKNYFICPQRVFKMTMKKIGKKKIKRTSLSKMICVGFYANCELVTGANQSN